MTDQQTTVWQPQPPRLAPPHMNTPDLFDRLHWHQRWEVFKGIYTPGRNDVAVICDRAKLPTDLRGKRVLDIGAWHGCFSFECERRGAAEVIALTLESDDQVGFSRLKCAVDSKVVRFVQQSVYELDPSVLGEFDVVLFFGVLYHLRHPLWAIDNIRKVCRGVALIETHVIDNYFLTRSCRLRQFIPSSRSTRN